VGHGRAVPGLSCRPYPCRAAALASQAGNGYLHGSHSRRGTRCLGRPGHDGRSRRPGCGGARLPGRPA